MADDDLRITEEDLIAFLQGAAKRSPTPPPGWTSPLAGIALSVGLLCQDWAVLEGVLRAVLLEAARMPDDMVSDLVLRCFDGRDQMEAIKVAVVGQPFPAELVDEVVETIDYIDNTLRPRRNRLVHDLWSDFPGQESATRLVAKPRVQRPQARLPRTLKLESAEEKASDIDDTCMVIWQHIEHLRRIRTALQEPTAGNVKALLEGRPPRPRLPHQREMTRPSGSARPRPKRRPRSSPE